MACGCSRDGEGAKTKARPHDEGADELQEMMLAHRMEQIDQKLLVLSGKGGVGKSTVAVNLAAALAEAGLTVGLLDVDIHGPSVPKLLGLEGLQPAQDHGQLQPLAVEQNLKVMSIGFLLDRLGEAVIWRGPMKYSVIRQFLSDVDWGRLDVLVIDSPPGTGDEPLSVAEMVGQNASAVIVTTPQDLAVADVRRSISFCRTLELPVAGVIENMSGMACPHCGKVVDLFKTGGGQALARECGVPFLGCLPLDPQVVACGDEGTPFVRGFASGLAGQAMTRVVQSLLASASPAAPPAAHDQTPASAACEPENRPMRIAIPVAEGKLCMHFGHCEQFLILDVDRDSRTIVARQSLTPPPHEPGVIPRWLGQQKVTLVIAGGMGQRAQAIFAENGIAVVAGAAAGQPEQVALAYLAGTLETGPNVCDH